MQSSILDELNPQQQRAVTTVDGPILILAGAGSGKTKTLTHRIAYLLNEHSVSPTQILAVTFTNKAAAEMRERTAQLLGQSADNRSFLPFLGTFHSICVRLLRRDGQEIGIDPNFIIFDSADQKAAVKRAMQTLKLDPQQHKPRTLAGLISSAKNELVEPSQYGSTAATPNQQAAGDIYPEYQRILRGANALDFDDLIMKTVQLAKQVPAVLEKWQRQFAYVMVDEYQDTNTAQYQLVKLLAAEHHNICVVGDDWQSIYSWRGADFRNILNFSRDYPEVTTIKLEQNYRSTEAILDAAHAIIDKNKQRSDKKLWTSLGSGQPVKVHQANSERHEAELLIRRIRTAVDVGTRGYNDFAVLYRTNAQSRSLEEMLLRYSLPYRIVGGTRFYERAEVKDMLAYLRLVFQPNDIASFERVVNTPTRGIGKKSLQNFEDWLGGAPQRPTGPTLDLDASATAPTDLYEALQRVDRAPGLSAQAQKGFGSFARILEQSRNFMNDGGRVSELVELLAKRSGYLDYLDDGSLQAEDRLENVRELISVAKDYDDVGLAGFLEEVALVSDVDSYDEQTDAITLMTLHSAKGLEFPVVFMVGLEEGIFPHSRAQFDAEQLEEERRLAYVGMTRAKEELHLLHATSRLLYGTTQHNPPARFLSEIDAEHTQADLGQAFSGSSVMVDTQPKIETDPEVQVNVVVGDRVSHGAFGVGTIVALDGELATVKFNKGGSKQLNLAFAPLTKL